MFSFWRDYNVLEEGLTEVQRIIDQRLTIEDADIAEAVWKFSNNGGKMLRPALFLLFAGLAADSPRLASQKQVKIAASLELLHLATLIHDDIIDDADTRRKQVTIQAQLGKDTAVYAGDFIYTVYFELLTETMADTPFLSRNAHSMKRILNGELSQKALRGKTEASLLQYLHVISGKTGELIALACLEGAYFGGLDEVQQQRARRIGRDIGLAFQIYDDILNFSLEFVNEKPILTDVTQGIYTLPLLIAKEKEPTIILKYLESPSELTKKDLIELAKLMKECGAMDEALDIAAKLTDKALGKIAKLPDGTNKKILTEATKKLLKREY